MKVNMYIHAFDKDGDMKITRNEFCKTVRKMPNILQPALHFQVFVIYIFILDKYCCLIISE